MFSAVLVKANYHVGCSVKWVLRHSVYWMEDGIAQSVQWLGFRKDSRGIAFQFPVRARGLLYTPQHPDQCPHEREGGGGDPVQITGARWYGRWPRARLFCTCFCLSLQYHYLSTVQINPFRPSPSYSATESQSFRFTIKIFSRSTLAGAGEGGRKNFSTEAPTRSQRPWSRPAHELSYPTTVTGELSWRVKWLGHYFLVMLLECASCVPSGSEQCCYRTFDLINKDMVLA
jgi:hypothetical protein